LKSAQLSLAAASPAPASARSGEQTQGLSFLKDEVEVRFHFGGAWFHRSAVARSKQVLTGCVAFCGDPQHSYPHLHHGLRLLVVGQQHTFHDRRLARRAAVVLRRWPVRGIL